MTLIADAPVDIDAEGFLTNPSSGTSTDRPGDRRRQRRRRLTDRHWLVVTFMRKRYLAAVPPVDPLARQDRRPDQGALPALPQGSRQARRQDRRHSQAQGLHLKRSTR